jgi:hypothetical protein
MKIRQTQISKPLLCMSIETNDKPINENNLVGLSLQFSCCEVFFLMLFALVLV